MVFLTADAHVCQALEFGLVYDSQFKGVTIGPVSLILGEYRIGFPLVNKEQGACRNCSGSRR